MNRHSTTPTFPATAATKGWVTALIGSVLLTFSAAASAADLKVIALPAITPVVERIHADWEKSTGYKIAAHYDVNIDKLNDIIDAGDFDVAVFPEPQTKLLLDRGKLVAESVRPFARLGITVWIKSGVAKPDISTTDAFKHALLNAKSISYTRESAAGQYLSSLMERLGIADELRPKTKLLGGGGQNPRAVASGDVELGLSVTSDGFGVAGVDRLGPLPPDIQRTNTFSAAVSRSASNPKAAADFVTLIASAGVATLIEPMGFDPIRK